MITTILTGHISPETAFIIPSYPYGGLRCKMRCWLETNKKGTRFVTQTTNPKITSREIWNKPKASTYTEISGAMFLDEKGHVQWESIGQYSDVKKCQEFLGTFGEAATNLDGLKKWTRRKVIFEEEMSKFTPRPEYGSALFNHAYLAARHRFEQEEI